MAARTLVHFCHYHDEHIRRHLQCRLLLCPSVGVQVARLVVYGRMCRGVDVRCVAGHVILAVYWGVIVEGEPWLDCALVDGKLSHVSEAVACEFNVELPMYVKLRHNLSLTRIM
jgi:hypothetical protein